MQELKFETVNYTVRETGNEIRRALRDAFPGVKFSLRGSRGTGHGWFSLSWTDGPMTYDVDKLTNGFRSSYFDGMDDSTHAIPATMYADSDGVIREHRYTCDGVNSSRDYSVAARAWAHAYVDAHGGVDVWCPGFAYPTYDIAENMILARMDLRGIDASELTMPERDDWTGRHVASSYVVDNGRDYGVTGRHCAAV